jgi:hypothetical protein
MRQKANEDSEFERLTAISELSAVRVRIAAQRLRDRLRFEMRYNPDWQSEPRVPAGQTGGGQWANLGAVAAQRIRARLAQGVTRTADIASDLEDLGGGQPVLRPSPSGAAQFIFPNGMILRFDIMPGQYKPYQSPHINLEMGGKNYHINVGE